MGAGASRSAHDQELNAADPEQSKSLYQVLDVSEEATTEEIKKAFRKAALACHPDKNPDRVEWAQSQFISVQRAYEVLSDDQERAFYDRNREELARGDTAPEVDLRAKHKAERAPHLSTRQVMRFFDSSAWKGFDDSDHGFYSVYAALFDLIIKDEILAQPYPGDPPFVTDAPEYPSFGTSAALYDKDSDAGPAIKHFYAIFQYNFVSRKAFSSADQYRISEAPDRRHKRAMEKENRRAREEARKEYNDTVRSLAAFLKKRDPRFLNSSSTDPMKARAKEMQKFKADMRQAAVERAQRRQEEAEAYVAREQDWQKTKHYRNGEFSEDEEGISGEEQEEEGWYCAACDKTFLSQGGWDNHERSKKHLKAVEQLRRQMLADDVEFELAPKQSMTDETDLAQEEDPTALDAGSPQASASVTVASDHNSDDYQRPKRQLGKKARRKARKNAQQVEVEDQLAQTSLDDKQSNPRDAEEPDQPPEAAPRLSKKDKRRAREKTKAEQAEIAPQKCNVCEQNFVSRSKLFNHVKEEGHELAAASGTRKKNTGMR